MGTNNYFCHWEERDTFVYNGETYLVGSIIKLTETGKKQLKTQYTYTQLTFHATFDDGTVKRNNKGSYYGFYVPDSKCAVQYGSLCTNDLKNSLEDYVEEVSRPVTDNDMYIEKDYNLLLIGWVIYVLVMIFSSIFKDAVWFWISETIFFIVWRFNRIRKKVNVEGLRKYCK